MHKNYKPDTPNMMDTMEAYPGDNNRSIYFRIRISVYIYGFDGWMTCDFMSFSTIFQSYQEDEGLIMKDCVQ